MKNGFSTLFIVIILGISSLGLMIFLTTSSFWSMRGSINTKYSNQAKSLANACAEISLDMIRQNNTLLGSGTINIGSDTCSYNITSLGGNSRNISASGTVGSTVRKIDITTSAFNPIVISTWQEIP
jgi:hypothetical protein